MMKWMMREPCTTSRTTLTLKARARRRMAGTREDLKRTMRVEITCVVPAERATCLTPPFTHTSNKNMEELCRKGLSTKTERMDAREADQGK
jgi:uncharacterized protein YndB with AHSA1/START domain